MAVHEAWIFQRPEQLREMGEAQAPHYVGWYDPDGRRKSESCGPGPEGLRRAKRRRLEITSQLMTGTYEMKALTTWTVFVAEYDRRILAGLAPRSRDEALASLRCFERLTRIVRVFGVTGQTVDDFTAARRQETTVLNGGGLVSPATVNKDLRHVKAALAHAVEWGYLSRVPRFRMERVPKKLPTYTPPEDFAKLYRACESARWPDRQPFTPADWWRGVLVIGLMTGWRIGQILGLRRADVDLERGTAITRVVEGNKAKRELLVPLHALIVDHLRRLPGFDSCVFPWNHGRRMVFEEYHKLQDVAGVKRSDGHYYGFHDLRRAFATMNADRLTPDALQALMQHKDYQTTQVYIAIARQLAPAVHDLYVPDLPPAGEGVG